LLEVEAETGGRDAVVEFLRRELIGPAGGEDELLADPPHRRYVMGTLYPQETDTGELEEIEEEDAAAGSVRDELADDPVTLAHEWMPSSVGLTFFVRGTDAVSCRVWGARYDTEREGRSAKRWRRAPLASEEDADERLLRPEPERRRGRPEPVLQGRALLESFWRPLGDGYLLTVSLVNPQTADEDSKVDPELTLHQVGFECLPEAGEIIEYPHVDALSTDPEDAELRLLYRAAKVYAVGHGCAAEWEADADGAVRTVKTQFLPTFTVPALTQDVDGRVDILSLAELADERRSAADLDAGLNSFIERYEAWIEALPAQHPDISIRFEPAKLRLLDRLRITAAKMREGAELLAADDQVRTAFRLANLAMLMQMRHARSDLAGTRRPRNTTVFEAPDYASESEFRWYPFQLAFQLLVLPSIADEGADDRDAVDLLWFPTGGGKTEAYLALAAFQVFLRRLRRGDRGGGTAVITRYTLRLLTSQQFQRAAAMICAAELIRRQRSNVMGDEPLSIGLWVGDEAAPNSFAKAVELYEDMLDEAEPVSRFQLEQCPWCGTELVPRRREEDADAYGFRASNGSFSFFCPTASCPFHERLPVAVVDQELYERPPTLLIATVDKFARLTWVADAGVFFGGERYDPPSLIIQDELHLLSGPLGTTVGLYESAVEALIAYNGARPKVIASTATIRRADEQAVALFGRRVRLFPPSGLEAGDSYFAKIDMEKPGRRYVGVMAPSHTISTAIIHTASALLQAPLEVPLNAAEQDGYGTLVVYHNSLRELGRTVTLARDDIPARIKFIAADEARMRKLDDEGVVELTSNVPGKELPGLLARMGVPTAESDSISLLATTNMLSVGVDVPRLGVMLMNGQPKTTSEYIQASSRVGRGAVPGLVVTLFAATKPRDRSHYESFLSYHAALYRYVEPTSVTPFSPPSRTRALHAALVMLVRHGAGLSADNDAGRFRRDDPTVQRAVQSLCARVAVVDPDEVDATSRQLDRLLEQWEELAEEAHDRGLELYYTPHGKQHLSLLKDFGASGSGWETLHSMRSVDRQCTIEILGAQK
jgi:Helicase conserved C-terminal domain